jgi:hypothetical protein
MNADIHSLQQYPNVLCISLFWLQMITLLLNYYVEGGSQARIWIIQRKTHTILDPRVIEYIKINWILRSSEYSRGWWYCSTGIWTLQRMFLQEQRRDVLNSHGMNGMHDSSVENHIRTSCVCCPHSLLSNQNFTLNHQFLPILCYACFEDHGLIQIV